MPRVKGGVVTRRRHKKILKLAKGYFGSKHTLFKTANEQVMRSLAYAYRDRKVKKREFRKLWITRINAACRMNGVSYSRFIDGLSKAGVKVNRKMLADIAVTDSAAFTNLVELSKKGLAGEIKPVTIEVKAATKSAAKAPKAATKVEKAVKEEAPKAAKAEKKEAPKAAKAEKKEAAVDLNSLKVDELKELAKAKGVSGYSKMKKAELIDALK